jgi:cell division protein FtsI/penicillin-binding protein 2
MKLINILVFLLSVSSLSAENPALQNQLAERLQNCNCAAVMVNPGSGEILAAVNADPILKEKHPPGSLMKIFTLMAYAQTHGSKFPEFQCPRSLAKDPLGCWDRNGHGIVNAQKAVAFSCNVYFRQLAAQTSDEAFMDVIKQFGIIDRSYEWDDPQSLRKVMTGTTMNWRITPMRMLRAYSSLFNGGNLWGEKSYVPSPEIRTLIHNGLLEGAVHGTSSLAKNEAGVEMLGKTGTSLLLVNGKTDYSRTQGWWIGLYPANDPKVAVMTFVRNGRGASDAAPKGGRALSAWLGLFAQKK